MNEDSPGPEVYKVIGAPGTGKTTRVVGNPELELKGLFLENMPEYSLDEQMLVTYTNAGVDEAADRLETMLDRPRSHIDDRITTIHSACFHLLDLNREQVVDHWTKKKWCEKYDLNYGWDDDSPDDIMAADKAEGNSLFDIYGWLQSNRKDLDEWEDCPQEWTGHQDPQYLMEEWEQWKDNNNMLGFGDMIEDVVELAYTQLDNLGWGVLFPDEDTTTREMFEAAADDPKLDPDIIRGKGAFVDTEVLYVDEVQDLTPLQWEWYLAQKLVAEKVYIGGDDDQTIYGWAGANPEFMLNEEGDFEVLETTYRIPREVWEACDTCIEQVDVRQDKTVQPDGEGGEVVTLRYPSTDQIIEHTKEGSVFILFRARYMIDEFTDKLHNQGIPYDNMSTFDTWSDDVVKVRDALAKIENGGSLSGDEVKALKENMEDQFIKKNGSQDKVRDIIGNIGGIEADEVKSMFNFRTTVSDWTHRHYLSACEELNYYQKEAIRGSLRNGTEDLYPERVRIGTIHSAKGKEAETVILATDSTQTILSNMAKETRDDPEKYISDAERRVYYVGMSRASDKLVLAEGVTGRENNIPLEHLLDGDVDVSRSQTTARRSSGW